MWKVIESNSQREESKIAVIENFSIKIIEQLKLGEVYVVTDASLKYKYMKKYWIILDNM